MVHAIYPPRPHANLLYEWTHLSQKHASTGAEDPRHWPSEVGRYCSIKAATAEKENIPQRLGVLNTVVQQHYFGQRGKFQWHNAYLALHHLAVCGLWWDNLIRLPPFLYVNIPLRAAYCLSALSHMIKPFTVMMHECSPAE